jgi:hypothetical protein
VELEDEYRDEDEDEGNEDKDEETDDTEDEALEELDVTEVLLDVVIFLRAIRRIAPFSALGKALAVMPVITMMKANMRNSPRGLQCW